MLRCRDRCDRGIPHTSAQKFSDLEKKGGIFEFFLGFCGNLLGRWRSFLCDEGSNKNDESAEVNEPTRREDPIKVETNEKVGQWFACFARVRLLIRSLCGIR